MGSMSLFHWIIVLIVVVVLFGAGKIPRLAEDLAKGIKAFKAGMKDEDTTLVEKRDLPPQAPSSPDRDPPAH
jgi:sec-independent protein translocase protein TatA